MTELLTAAQMRAIEHAAINSGEVTGLELMERAGQGVVEAIFEEWPDLKKTSHRAVVLCGPGNNGGDGFVVARLLKEWGWEVEVFLYGDAEKMPTDAKVNYERWTGIGSVTLELPKRPELEKTDLIVDALFGIGINRKLPEELASLALDFDINPVDTGNEFRFITERIIAIDVPSGLCADSGNSQQGGDSFSAALTVTFHCYKVGQFQYCGPYNCGKVKIKDIGLGNTALGAGTRLYNRTEIDLEWELKKDVHLHDHKFSHGHALIASGPATKTGAARLAARGALKIGAGLVTIASPSDALSENAAQLTAIMLRKADTTDQFKTLLSDDRISSICIGPGFARENESGGLDFNFTRAMVKTALSTGKNTVLDADALTAFKDTPDDLFKLLHKGCVLTPHGGEFKRLFPDIHAKLMEPATKGPVYSKVDATRDAAKRAGCVVLFKGADTVIAEPQGRASINSAITIAPRRG